MCIRDSADTVLNVPFQHHLAALMQSGLCGINLSQDIFTGNIFIYHTVDGLHLTNDLFQPTVQIVCIHTLFHLYSLLVLP